MRHHVGVTSAGITEVVAAAIIRGGTVLAARRSRPAGLAGHWEFPGGKAEAGESLSTALVRECREELSITIRVGMVIGRVELGPSSRLTLFAADLVAGEPAAGDSHDVIVWLSPERLTDVDWLPADLALLGPLRQALHPR